MKISGLTSCWNEESTIVFTIASLLPHVDYYVVVDSGSTDATLPLIKEFFAAELASGKLRLIEYGPLPDYDISKPKNAAIQEIRRLGCARFIRLDGDDVFYDNGAAQAVVTAKNLPDNVTLYTLNHWELYQNEIYSTKEWIMYLSELDGKNPFMCLRMPPGADPSIRSFPNRFDGSYGHARIYLTEGALSIGKWTDEAKGVGPGEDIHHPGYTRICKGNHDEVIVHYGWARPMAKKLAKGRIWSGEGNETADPRVSGIEKQWEIVNQPNISRMTYGMKYWPKYIIFPFDRHPEVFELHSNKVLNVYSRICAAI